MRNTKFITQTAVMTALLVCLQLATRALGQLVTGTCVNFVLALTALIAGLNSGITVAVISPFFAFLLGIGPAFLPLVPAICVGNAVFVVMIHLLSRKGIGRSAAAAACCAAAALCKSAALYGLIVKLILPLLDLNAKQAAAIAASFSWPQLVTAFAGSVLALLAAPGIKKALRQK